MSVRVHREHPDRLPPIIAVDLGPDDGRPSELSVTPEVGPTRIRVAVHHPDSYVNISPGEALDLGNALIQLSHQVRHSDG